MSDFQKISAVPSIFIPSDPVTERIETNPAEHLLESDVVTNNVPRATVGRQAQAGSQVTIARTRDSKELAKTKKRPGISSGVAEFHPLLPDPESHQGLHDVTTVDVAPLHDNDVKALNINTLALTLNRLSPRQQANMMRILSAKQNVQTRRKETVERNAATGRARMRAPGMRGLPRSVDFEHDDLPEIADHDAVEIYSPLHRPLASTLQNQGANPLVALMHRQTTMDHASQAISHMASLPEQAFISKIGTPRTPLEHIKQQASTMSEREYRLSQVLKANSTFEADAQNQAARFRQIREVRPLPHRILGRLIKEVGGLRDDAARESEIVALLNHVQKGQNGYIRELAKQLQTVKNPELLSAGTSRLQELLNHGPPDGAPAA